MAGATIVVDITCTSLLGNPVPVMLGIERLPVTPTVASMVERK
jgi:hypothetical protein